MTTKVRNGIHQHHNLRRNRPNGRKTAGSKGICTSRWPPQDRRVETASNHQEKRREPYALIMEREQFRFGLGPIAIFLIVGLVLIASGIKILSEYERAVIFRLGRLVKYRGPGLLYVIPLIEGMGRVDMRTIPLDVPSQDVITKDNVSIKGNAVLYFRVLAFVS